MLPRVQTVEPVLEDPTARRREDVAGVPEFPPDQWIGRVVGGRFKILEPLGAGGMADVYRAHEQGLLQRDVAIKVMTSQLSVNPTMLARFIKEAQMMAKVRHPNIVQIYDVGRDDAGHPYLAMELLSGQTLNQMIQSYVEDGLQFTWDQVAAIVLQICSALAAAHRHGVIHRDIKPSNCFCIETEGDQTFIKLLDFGIAKANGGESEDSMATPLTQEGMFLGTPHYAAPETIIHNPEWPIDGRADLFAVGVIMYQMLTGTLPFQGEHKLSVLMKTANERPQALRGRAPALVLSEAAETVVMTAMAIDPRQRYANAGALAAAIRATLKEPREMARPSPRSHQGVLVKGSISDLQPTSSSSRDMRPGDSTIRNNSTPVRPSIIVSPKPSESTPPPPGTLKAVVALETVAEGPLRRGRVTRPAVLTLGALLIGLSVLIVILIVDSRRSMPAPTERVQSELTPASIPEPLPAPLSLPIRPVVPPTPDVPKMAELEKPKTEEPPPPPPPPPSATDDVQSARRRLIRDRLKSLAGSTEMLACLPDTLLANDGLVDQIALSVTVQGNGSTRATAKAGGVDRRIPAVADKCILKMVTALKFPPSSTSLTLPITLGLD